MTAGVPAQAVTLEARDGRRLGAVLLRAEAPRAALSINGATGFRREFYLNFAAYCAARGYHTLAYDYRGIGASVQPPLAQEPARMSEWGRLDMPAALEWLAREFPQLPLMTLGHSVGGQLIGCMPNQALARAHVLVATSTGYWRRQRVPFRYQALLFWRVYGALALRRHGYVPRGLFWRGADLPPGVFLQWRRWCESAAPFGRALDADLSEEAFAAVRAPILALSFSDDPIATPAAVEAMLAAYGGARIERRCITPAAAGVRRIGHHGFFDPAHRASLWAMTLDWLDARCG